MCNEKLTIPTGKLFRSLRTIRGDWGLKTPLQEWCYLFSFGRAACSLVQSRVYEDDLTLSLWAYQGCVYFLAYFIPGVYTVCYYATKCLPCTCVLIGPIIGVRIKFNKPQTTTENKLFIIGLVLFCFVFSLYYFIYFC